MKISLFKRGGIVEANYTAVELAVFSKPEIILTKGQYYKLCEAVGRIPKCFRAKNTLTLKQFIRGIIK